jgi:hypothetical protein
MSSTKISFEDLVAGLRRGTSTHDANVRAAVDLLIWHEAWLRRPDFQRACIRHVSGTPYIKWREAQSLTENPPVGASSSQLTVLRVAVALGLDDFGLSGLGHAHRRAVAQAFAEAVGLRLEPAVPEVGHSHPDFIPGDPATCARCALEAGDEGRALPGGWKEAPGE